MCITRYACQTTGGPSVIQPQHQQNPLTRTYGLLILVILFWGVNWPIMKLGLGYVTPLWFATTRMFLGCLSLFFFLALQGRNIIPGRHDIPILLIIAVFQIFVPTSLIHSGLLFMEPGRSSILVFTIPLWVAPMAVFVLGERLSWRKIAGLLAGLGGIGVLFAPEVFDFNDTNALIGNVFMIISSFSFALAIILVRRHSWSTSVIRLLPWQMMLGTVFLAVAASAIEGAPDIEWSPPLVAIMAYNGPIASGFAFWAYVTVSRNLPAMSTALGSLGIPVMGIIASNLILGEAFSVSIVLGLALISLGVLAVSLDDLKKSKNT